MMLKKGVKTVLSIPKTIWVNFSCLPFHQAIKLPIWVSYDTKVMLKGGIKIDSKIKFAMIRIGFLQPLACSKETTRLYILKKGNIIFKGETHLGHGTKIIVRNNAMLIIGDNFAISGNTTVNCYKKIIFGNNIQFSWDCLVMDSDTHTIIGTTNEICNQDKEIIFGNKIWIGCKCTILKGAIIPNNCVIGACSLVSKGKFEENTIIMGTPAKCVKKIASWHI